MSEWNPDQEPEVAAAIDKWRDAKAAFLDHTGTCQECQTKPLHDALRITVARWNGQHDVEQPTTDYCPEGETLQKAEREASRIRWSLWESAIIKHEESI